MKIKFDFKKTLAKLAEKLLKELLKKVQKEDVNTANNNEQPNIWDISADKTYMVWLCDRGQV